MNPFLLFLILTIPVTALSYKSIKKPGSHGFYRFFGWEGILWLFANSWQVWFKDPFSMNQVFSWILLIISVIMVVSGVITMKKQGKVSSDRSDESLYGFEKTTTLVDTGIFSYIRHPLYSSLIYLTWGICLKNLSPGLIAVAVISTLLFYLTAVHDEKECTAYFGQSYIDYMKRTKRFIPYIF